MPSYYVSGQSLNEDGSAANFWVILHLGYDAMNVKGIKQVIFEEIPSRLKKDQGSAYKEATYYITNMIKLNAENNEVLSIIK